MRETSNESRKNLKNVNRSIFGQRFSTLLFCLLCYQLLLTGCGNKLKQWGEPLATDKQNTIINDFTQMTKRDSACPTTMIADLAITYTSPIARRAVSGSLQFSLPDDYKFVVTNPLGQILWAVVGNRKQFQTIDTSKRIYRSGELQSLLLEHQLPLFLVQNNWGEWLMGRNLFDSSRIVDIRQDNDQRGLWFTVKTSILAGEYEHLLIEPKRQLLLQRIITDRSGDPLAAITYTRSSTKIDKGQCMQPEHITISGLSYNSTIDLQLTAIEFQPKKKDYSLPAPPQYRHISLSREATGGEPQ